MPPTNGFHFPRCFLHLVVVLAWALSGLPAEVTRAAEPAESPPPNIVWLTVEDMSPWIGPYGDRTVPTPNLDRLAQQGVVYDNAFATSPVCAGPLIADHRHVLHPDWHDADAEWQSQPGSREEEP